MNDSARQKRNLRRQVVYSLSLLGFTSFMFGVSLLFPERFFMIYSPWSRFISGLLGFIVSFAAFSLSELLLYALILYLAGYLAVSVFLTITRTERWFYLWRFLTLLLALASSAVFLFMLLWGFQYRAPKVDAQMGLTLKAQYSQTELIETTKWLQTIINENAPLAPRSPDGEMTVEFRELAEATALAVEKLGQENPVFKAALVPPAKRITMYKLFDYAYIAGIYCPFTGEANVNPNTSDALLPFDMAHESAHRLGCAPEMDANFVAFLACMASDDPAIRYSGARGAYGYCVSHIESYEVLASLSASLTPFYDIDSWSAMKKVEYMNESIADVVAPISERANDSYLKVNGQEDGTRSYGRVAELLIAYYYAEVRK